MADGVRRGVVSQCGRVFRDEEQGGLAGEDMSPLDERHHADIRIVTAGNTRAGVGLYYIMGGLATQGSLEDAKKEGIRRRWGLKIQLALTTDLSGLDGQWEGKGGILLVSGASHSGVGAPGLRVWLSRLPLSDSPP